MKTYDVVFYFTGFFIAGVFLETSGLEIVFIVFISFLTASLFLFFRHFGFPKSGKIALLSFAAVLGALYSFGFCHYREARENIVFGERISFQATVVGYPERSDYQVLVLSLEPPLRGKISAKLALYPEFSYGDLIEFEGVVKKPSPGRSDYLAKDGIKGTISFPRAEVISRHNASILKEYLFSFKERFLYAFEKSLYLEEANLLGGLTLGERAGFSDEFREAMKNSGTTHLVALSGYNISILVIAAMSIFSCFLRRRHSFIATIFIVFFFVLATGGEASVVRAAIMGSILLLAEEIGRVYSMRNAILVTAFFMVLFNPLVLRFDVGFQLSFLALLGIIYLSPALKKIFKAGEEPGVLAWRENFWTTLSAQMAVFPILISSFGNFSLFSIISNVLILGFIPLTMALGFVLGFVDLLCSSASFILAWLVHPFLLYETSVIWFFGAKDSLMVSFSTPFFIFIYCIAVAGFVFYARKKLLL